MPWVRFDDDWYDDPELIDAGPLAMMAWPILISWCARNLTDGKVPAGQIRRLIDWSALPAEPEQAIAPLVANGRLQEIAGGYLITNYLRYQPSRAKVLEDRSKDRRRKARERSEPPPESVQPESARNPGPPVPVPVPDIPSSSSSSSQVPAEVWPALAKKKLANAEGVNNTSAWLRKVAANDRDELGPRAEEIVAMFDITVPQLVDVLAAGGSSPLLNSLPRRTPQDAA